MNGQGTRANNDRTMRCAACGRGGLPQDAERCPCGKALNRRNPGAGHGDGAGRARSPRTLIGRAGATAAVASSGAPAIGTPESLRSPAPRTHALHRRAFDGAPRQPAAPASTRRAHPAQIRAALDQLRGAEGAPRRRAPTRSQPPGASRRAQALAIATGGAAPLWQEPSAGLTSRASSPPRAEVVPAPSVAPAPPVGEAMLEGVEATPSRGRWPWVFGAAVVAGFIAAIVHGLGG